MYRYDGVGFVGYQDCPSFSYPNDIIGRRCFVNSSGIWSIDGYARDCATGLAATSNGWKSDNGARKHALEELCKKLHVHFAPIRAKEAAERKARELQARLDRERQARERLERERQAREAEIRRLQQQAIQQREAQRAQLNARKNSLNNQLTVKQNEYNLKKLELNNLDKQINKEEKEINQFKIERSDKTTKLLVALGHTGDGKSTVCNRLSGDISLFGDKGSFKTSGNGKSCTQQHFSKKVVINNKKITIVDTPGFSDSFGRDREHGNKLCKYLRGCGGINNILLIRNSTNVRFDKSFQNMLSQYHLMFGDIFFKLLIIIATRVDSKINKLQFEQNNQIKSMQQDIASKFQLNINIPVISIGLEYYKDSINDLVNIISDNKVECKHIKSPIDKLKSKQKILKGRVNALKLGVDRIQNEINSVNLSINAL